MVSGLSRGIWVYQDTQRRSKGHVCHGKYLMWPMLSYDMLVGDARFRILVENRLILINNYYRKYINALRKKIILNIFCVCESEVFLIFSVFSQCKIEFWGYFLAILWNFSDFLEK